MVGIIPEEVYQWGRHIQLHWGGGGGGGGGCHDNVLMYTPYPAL